MWLLSLVLGMCLATGVVAQPVPSKPSPGQGATYGAPTALVGLTAVPGTSGRGMRSDAAPALDQTISPTMSGAWGFTNTIDASAAIGGTAPMLVGTALPNTCRAGKDLFYKTNAPAGQKLYACLTSPSNTWELQAGGVSGSGTLNALTRWASGGASLVDSGLTDDGNVLGINRGVQGKVTTVTNANITLTTANYSVALSTGNSNRTVTLPAATGLTGQSFHVTKTDTGTGGVIIAPNGSDTLNGVNTATGAFTVAHGGIDIEWESNNGWVVGQSGSVPPYNLYANDTNGFLVGIAPGASGNCPVSNGTQFSTVKCATFNSGQEITFSKSSATASAPGSGSCKLAFIAAVSPPDTAGTCRLIAYCGTSATAVVIASNIGASC